MEVECDHSGCTGKFCPTCQTPKLTCEFYQIGTSGNTERQCKSCRSKAAADSAKKRRVTSEGREKYNTYSRRYKSENSDKFRAMNLKRAYGITPEDYDRILKEQDGRCAICKSVDPGSRSEFFHVDHDHKTLTIRGLLCHSCNLLLGQAKDSIETLANAISYLDYYRNGGQ